MKKLLHKIKVKRNEKGAADVVALMLGVLILLSLMITALDASIYFMTRSQIQAGARDGARTVAIFGGAGTSSKVTELQKAYGNSNSCDGVPSGKAAGGRSVECEVYKQLEKQSIVNATINKVSCGPNVTNYIGRPTYCDVDWTYKGMPGSPINFFVPNSSNEDGVLQMTSRPQVTPFKGRTITGTSQSEVKLTTKDLTEK